MGAIASRESRAQDNRLKSEQMLTEREHLSENLVEITLNKSVDLDIIVFKYRWLNA